MSRKEEETEEMLDEYAQTLEAVSKRVFTVFEEMNLQMDVIVDFLVMTLSSICMFADDPKKAAKGMSKELSDTVKEMMKEEYGSKPIGKIESKNP